MNPFGLLRNISSSCARLTILFSANSISPSSSNHPPVGWAETDHCPQSASFNVNGSPSGHSISKSLGLLDFLSKSARSSGKSRVCSGMLGVKRRDAGSRWLISLKDFCSALRFLWTSYRCPSLLSKIVFSPSPGKQILLPPSRGL